MDMEDLFALAAVLDRIEKPAGRDRALGLIWAFFEIPRIVISTGTRRSKIP